MTSRLLAMFMCCQVLFCPALCVNFCKSQEVCNYDRSEQCDCCSGSDSSIPGEQKQPGSPCDPGSDSCNCFCGGAVALQAEELLVVDFFGQLVIPRDVQLQIDPRTGLECYTDRHEDNRKLFGRELLRAYCVLLI